MTMGLHRSRARLASLTACAALAMAMAWGQLAFGQSAATGPALTAQATQPQAQPQPPMVPESRWPPAVLAALQRANVPLDALALVVLPTTKWGAQWLHQPDRSMQPASTMKLVTSVVALDRLGPNHRGFTELLTSATQDGDVLRGELVLRGGADPELGLPQMWALLAELRYLGIRELAGDIVLDRSLFRPARMDLGAPPFDEHPEFYYNVIPDALHLSSSQVVVELTSIGAGTLTSITAPSGNQTGSQSGAQAVTQAASQVSARLLPPLPGIVVDASELQLTDRACKDWSGDWQSPPRVVVEAGTSRVVLRGGFARNCTQRAALQLLDRNVQVQAQLRGLWQQLGGEWRGQVREGAAPADARSLAKHMGRPWGELIRPLNKRSDNAFSRLLYLSLGVKAMAQDNQTPTAELARREVLRWFAEQRINTTGLVTDNGSGLSRSERITPRQMAQMLVAARSGKQAPELMMSLPVVGVDGNLRNRITMGPSTGQARLKGGTLRNVVALAGYVPDNQGNTWIMSAMINHEQAVKARPALEALVEWLSQAGPVAAKRRHLTGSPVE